MPKLKQKPAASHLFLLILFFAFQCLVTITHAQSTSILDENPSDSKSMQTYIVQIRPPKNMEHISKIELEQWHQSFLPNTTLDTGEPRLLFSYRHVLSGFAARLTQDELKQLEKIDGFVSANVEKIRSLQTTYTPTFLNLDSWDSTWQKTNYGEGIIIGVIDSGVFDTHPSFTDDGSMPEPPIKWRGCCMINETLCNPWVPTPCNNKLIGAMSFTPSGSLTDKIGHGTHVASIAAGNKVEDAEVLGQAKGRASGMAPRAHIASYKVCLKADACHDSQVLAGMDHAIDDGVDVISMSIGRSEHEELYDNPISVGSFVAMSKGIIMSACAGNDGPAPNTVVQDAPWIMTVGASSIDRSAIAKVKLGNGMELTGESAYQPEDWDSPMLPIVYPGEVDTDVKKACLEGAFDDLNITGKIVLCGVGLNDNVEKGKLIKEAGGKAMIVLNQQWDGYTTKNEPHVIPAAHVNHKDALKIVNYFLTDENATATIRFEGTQLGARRAPAVASFSSRGPSMVNGGILKPDVVGPGVNILGAWNKAVGPETSGSGTDKNFNFASGCSMATPHLAGIAALLKSSHPDWSPAAIKSAIMTTAHATDRSGKPLSDEGSNDEVDATFYDMGAGHVDPSKADDPGLIYDITAEHYIGYLCGLGYTNKQVYRTTNQHVDCSTVESISAEHLNYPAISVSGLSSLYSDGEPTSASANRTVTNVGEADSSYTAEIEAPDGLNITVIPDTLQFTSVGEEKNFTVQVSSIDEGLMKAGSHLQGQLVWKSDKHSVRSPILII